MKHLYYSLFMLFNWLFTVSSLSAQIIERKVGLFEHNTNYVYFGQVWLEEVKVNTSHPFASSIPHNSIYTYNAVSFDSEQAALNGLNNLINDLNNVPDVVRYYDVNTKIIFNLRHAYMNKVALVILKINNIYYYDIVNLNLPQISTTHLVLDRKIINSNTTKLNAAILGGPADCSQNPTWSYASTDQGNHFFNSSFPKLGVLTATFSPINGVPCHNALNCTVSYQNSLSPLTLTAESQGCVGGKRKIKVTVTGGMGVYEVATGKQIHIAKKTTSANNSYDYYQLLETIPTISNNVFELDPGTYTFKIRDASHYDSKVGSQNMNGYQYIDSLSLMQSIGYTTSTVEVQSCSVTTCPTNGVNLGSWSVTNQSIYARSINNQLWVAQPLPAEYGEDAIKIRGKNMISRADVTSNYKNSVSCFAGSDTGIDGLVEPTEFNSNGIVAGYEKVSNTGSWGLIENYWRRACPSDGTNLGVWSVTGQSLVARKINNLLWVAQALPADYGTDAIVIRGKNMISRGDVTSNYKNKLNCFAGLDSDYGGLAEPTDFNSSGVLAGYEKVSFTGSWGLIQNYWRKKAGSCYTISMRYGNTPVGVAPIPNNTSSNGLSPLSTNTFKFEPVPNENTFYIKAIGGNNGYLTVGSPVDPWNTFFILQAQFSGGEAQKWNVTTLSGATSGYDTRISPKTHPALTWNYYGAPGTPYYHNIYGLATWWGGISGEGGETESFKRVAVGCPNSRVAAELETSEEPVIDLSISPNPTPDKFRASIVTKELGKYNFLLMTNSGELIKSWKVDTEKGDKEIEVDISNYRYGSYLLKVVSESGKTTVKRVFKHEE